MRKEYNSRWEKPLVNGPILYGDLGSVVLIYKRMPQLKDYIAREHYKTFETLSNCYTWIASSSEEIVVVSIERNGENVYKR